MVLGGCADITPSTTTPLGQRDQSVSPFMGGEIQGIAIDPSGDHFVSFTHSIYAFDANWKLLWKNTQPFAGLAATVNHIGDVEYSNGLIYAPVEYFEKCGDFSSQLIVTYDAGTGRLVNWVDISGDAHEASAAAVIAKNGQVVISSYCDDNHGASTLWVYSLDGVTNGPAGSALTKQDTIALSQRIIEIQGLSWDPQTDEFLMSSDLFGHVGYLWLVSATGTVMGPAYTVPQSEGKELEGVDATQDEAYYAEQGHIYRMPMPRSPLEMDSSTGLRPRNDGEAWGLPSHANEIAGRDLITEPSAGNRP